MLKLSTSHVSGVLALITAAFVFNAVACSSSKPAKKAGAGGAEEEECETDTKKSTSKLTDDFELTQTGTGSNSSTGSSTATKTGTGTTTSEGPTYTDDIKKIVDKSCAKSGCHNKGGTDPDLSTYANIKKEKDDFFRTLDPEDDKAMPPGGESAALKEADLKLLEDWKDADFPEGKAEEEEEDTDSSTATKTATSTSKSTSKCGSSSNKTEEEEEEE